MSTLRPLSRTMHPDNFNHLQDELARVDHARNIFAGHYRDDHEYRRWEYAICLAAAGGRQKLQESSVLDVGGCTSILGPLMAWGGADVTVIDIGYEWRFDELQRIALTHPTATPGGSLKFITGDFTPGLGGAQYDLVTCVSVIEHVDDEPRFFLSLKRAVAPGGTLALTTDFDPSGNPFCGAHLRTYPPEALKVMGTCDDDFWSEGGFDYFDRGRWVLGYNFASLVLKKRK